jgi:hypothetical protein
MSGTTIPAQDSLLSKIEVEEIKGPCVFSSACYFLFSRKIWEGTKSRDISSGDRHGARDVGRGKNKRLGGVLRNGCPICSLFLSLIAGIARTSLPCHITFYLDSGTLAQPTLEWCRGLALRFFLLFASMEENRTHLATVAGNFFRIVLSLLLLITTSRRSQHGQYIPLHYRTHTEYCIYLFSTTCSWAKDGGLPHSCFLLFFFSLNVQIGCDHFTFALFSERRVGVRRCYGVSLSQFGGRHAYWLFCLGFRAGKRTRYHVSDSSRAQIGIFY